MLINIRGTSGSGKSTLVRRVLDLYPNKVVFKKEGRKQPIGYLYKRDNGRDLAIIGHYETPCGGCDTIQKMDDIFQLVRDSYEAGYDVIFEGLLISADKKRITALWEEVKDDLLVIGLDTNIETCIDSVNQRRWAKNPDKEPVNPKNTISKHRGVQNTMKYLEELGVQAEWHDRDAAFARIRRALDV